MVEFKDDLLSLQSWKFRVGAIHEAAVLFWGSPRIKKPTRHCPYPKFNHDRSIHAVSTVRAIELDLDEVVRHLLY
jgi:hypothetical protein